MPDDFLIKLPEPDIRQLPDIRISGSCRISGRISGKSAGYLAGSLNHTADATVLNCLNCVSPCVQIKDDRDGLINNTPLKYFIISILF